MIAEVSMPPSHFIRVTRIDSGVPVYIPFDDVGRIEGALDEKTKRKKSDSALIILFANGDIIHVAESPDAVERMVVTTKFIVENWIDAKVDLEGADGEETAA